MPCLSDEVSYEWEQTLGRVVITLDACLSSSAFDCGLVVHHSGVDRHGRGGVELFLSHSMDTPIASLLLYAPVCSAQTPDSASSVELIPSDTGPLVVLQLAKTTPEWWPALLGHPVPNDERGDFASIDTLNASCRAELALPNNIEVEAVALKDSEDTGVADLLQFHESVMVRAVKAMGRVVPALEGDKMVEVDTTDAEEAEALLCRARAAGSMEESRLLMGAAATHYRYPSAVTQLCASCSMSFPERYLWLAFGALTLESAACALQLATLYAKGDELPHYASLAQHLTQLAALRGDTTAMRTLGSTWDYAADLRGHSARAEGTEMGVPKCMVGDVEEEDEGEARWGCMKDVPAGVVGAVVVGGLLVSMLLRRR